VHAYVNRCPHAGRPLDFPSGHFLTPDGELFQCKAHGALFEKNTGLCIAGPCVDEFLHRLPIELVGDEVRLAVAVDVGRLQRGPW
jgi:nitrite reductase/ring-hydroxylating ferredoxin subunit